MMMSTGYGPRNITCIPPSTSKSDRGMHVLSCLAASPHTSQPWTQLDRCLHTLLHVPSDLGGMCLLAVMRVLEEARY
jgi:hypothetical protein